MINDVAIKLKINENRELESITWPSITKSELFQEKKRLLLLRSIRGQPWNCAIGIPPIMQEP